MHRGKKINYRSAIIQQRQKIYKKKYENGPIALKHITLGVQKETILGLLGPNDAGKSTTFSILSSLICKSGGCVQINQQEVERYNQEIFRNVGICPQFDCIWENLTPVEHLSIQFLDEPISGVDPISRRFLWKTLKLGVKLRNTSVVITTQSMDEAESLCDKISLY